jgi:hypothetical protein
MRVPFRGRGLSRKLRGSDRAAEVAGHGDGAGSNSNKIEWVVDDSNIRLGLGDSVNYDGDADLVFSHVYGPLPPQLIGKPAIVNVYGNKKAKAEEWVGAELHELGKWATGHTNTVYVANMLPWECPIGDLIEEEFVPRKGWMPLALPLTILEGVRGHSVRTVFDGFMGRGTIGRAAVQMGLRFVGIDREPERVAMAREYLGC